MRDWFLADDLSGALDAGAAFHLRGRRVRLVSDPGNWTHADDTEVIGVNTETRNAPPAAAAARVGVALARAAETGARLVYKKIDSTLRGPVAAELDALRRALPGHRILFCPANPAAGRTVEDGELRVRGVPVHRTEFARDPVHPVRESRLRLLTGGDPAIATPDATRAADLAAAVAALAGAPEPWLAVGSGALAGPVAERLAGPWARPDPAIPAPPPGSVLLVGGSAHPLNRGQAAALTRARGVPLAELAPAAPGPAIATVAAALRAGPGAALRVAEERGNPAAVLAAVASAVEAVLQQGGARRIFLTGGETARAVLGRLGAGDLEVAGEIEPGLVLARAVTARFGPLLLAVKPGGFGDEATWIRAWDRLRAEGAVRPGPAGPA